MQTNRLLYNISLLIVLSFFVGTSFSYAQNKKKFVVVLDAGHGGHDPGNLGNGYKEKDIALNIVLGAGKELEKNPDIKVIYTRKTDVFIKLRERAAIANNADADLFVSVHCNAFSNQAHGTETFVLGLHASERNFEVAKKENEVIYLEENYDVHYEGFNPNSPESLIGLTLMQEAYLDQSIQLAHLVESNFANSLKRKSRGVKQAGFWVLHNTYMPSVLIETGFLTYKNEGAYLNSSKGQKDMATAIKDAILKYKKSLDQNIGESVFKFEDPIEDIEASEKEQIIKDVVFKVQIAASSKKLEPKSYNFKGLSDISRDKEGALYKYFYGNTSDLAKAKQLHKTAKNKGYTTSYIVAFKDGKKISVDEALKTSAN
ncbi:N-acetylmuramoyl-L-alanine amidase [Oceanihabitans sediminis]|uniref:N-acetylmuramoyl-L-alanine amidase n=1 Tax=Oceanihabitans sediminis TaxID=1812012 RepID=A0A368P4D4_9FLAO|nr:N-acetylmuramoyl-L-alanine amidase [Oceanihabitans sediminis]MDX1278752.1 N-acetylmuramoyl-L-alanine amidase [Oceanihabitans sediminis]MDX1773699.1 N-acetylmuramoyl-L-alanine amidase [Oceanihabitans sediminis]RBP33144.1 N-acetylmuramoyl-L-alanine amidase [Oceanihabitans sediminis]RCU57348.1 N-acetylmuramoyl-L-alanine amidase [Oceanihabitans sediminis]